MTSTITSHSQTGAAPATPAVSIRSEVSMPLTIDDSTDRQRETAGFNLAIDHRPAVVVPATGAQDVVVAVRYAAAHSLSVAVQATGHGGVRPADGSVFVSTRRMQDVQIDPQRRIARVGAGVRWRAVIDAAAPYGLAPLSGSSSGVGVVGYSLGGGVGHLGRLHGFAADQVVAIEMVTADGVLRRVTAETDPELFWAVRGAKHNFGIVTALEFRLFPVPEFSGGSLLYPATFAGDVLHAFAEWAAGLPDAAAGSVAILRMPDMPGVPGPLRGKTVATLRFSYAGAAAEAERWFAPMRDVAPAMFGGVGPMAYRDVDRIHSDPQDPMPSLDQGSGLRDLPAEAVDGLLAAAGPDTPLPVTVVELRLLGGAYGRPAAVPNAVAGRAAAFSLLTVAPLPPPLVQVAPRVLAGIHAAMSPWSAGTVPLNFLGGAGDPDAVAGVFGPATRDRLLQLKSQLDPHGLFRHAHALAVPGGAA